MPEEYLEDLANLINGGMLESDSSQTPTSLPAYIEILLREVLKYF